VALLSLGRFMSSPSIPNAAAIEQVVDRLEDDGHLLEDTGDPARAKMVLSLVDVIRQAGLGIEVSVFLVDTATTDEISRIRAVLESSPGVESVRFESKRQAYERFLRIFKDRPQIIQGISPDALPASFHAKVSDAEAGTAVLGRLQGLRGVETAGVRPSFVTEAAAFLTGRDSLIRTCAVPGAPSLAPG